jgi:hypothetical protein
MFPSADQREAQRRKYRRRRFVAQSMLLRFGSQGRIERRDRYSTGRRLAERRTSA